MAHKTYAFISDGGIQEEVSQGAGRIAGYLGLNNLIMFYDANEVQLSTRVDQVTFENTAAKYEAWDWRVITINGNDPDEIRGALIKAQQEKEKPVLIIGRTTMGKGGLTDNNESFEGQVSTHGQPLSAAGGSVDKTILNLGGDPQYPFAIFPETKEVYQKILDQKRELVKTRQLEFENWKKANPELARKLENMLSGKIPSVDYSKIEFKPNIATRAASSTVLGEFANTFDNMLVMSADLANSDKTDGFLKKSKAIVKADFSGAFLHAGVSELTMAAMANGMALSNLIPVCGTFFAFSDFMKPAIRLAALMQLPVKYVWTHDSFRVGEDGPTHQPIEQEAQIRLLEKLKNHKGKNSMLVLRPADSAETAVAWKMAVENQDSPTGLIFSRQNVDDLPAKTYADCFKQASQAEKGAYIVQEAEGQADVNLVASGSEVSTLIEAAELLRRDGYKVQVTSVISEGLFRLQDEEYQNKVIPGDIPVFALTAGLPVTMEGLARCWGKVIGLDHFGYSAPYRVLDEKFGFYGERICKEVIRFLDKFKN
jgi:transketolase